MDSKKSQVKQADVLKQATNKDIPWAEIAKQMHEDADKQLEETLNSSEVWYI